MATDTATKFDPRLVRLVALQDRVGEMLIELEQIGEEIASIAKPFWPQRDPNEPGAVTEAWMLALQTEIDQLRAA